MARIIRAAEERRDEILDAALRLFATQGYDRTPVTAILEAVGIAKGTFYYHFASKEEVMDGIIQRYNRRFAAQARAIADDDQMPVLHKFGSVLGAFQMDDALGVQLIDELNKPQNALMHQKMMRSILEMLTPILVQIIEQGIAEKLLHNPYPKQTIEMLLIYAQVAFDEGLLVTSEAERQQAITALAYNLDMLFHAAPGTFDFVKAAANGE